MCVAFGNCYLKGKVDLDFLFCFVTKESWTPTNFVTRYNDTMCSLLSFLHFFGKPANFKVYTYQICMAFEQFIVRSHQFVQRVSIHFVHGGCVSYTAHPVCIKIHTQLTHTHTHTHTRVCVRTFTSLENKTMVGVQSGAGGVCVCELGCWRVCRDV